MLRGNSLAYICAPEFCEAALNPLGYWNGHGATPAFLQRELTAVAQRFREPVHVVQAAETGAVGVAQGGTVDRWEEGARGEFHWLATLPATYPEWLGDRSFAEAHGVRFPYVAGAMANGIASTRLVIAMSRGGFLSFFGSAGLSLPRVEQAISTLTAELGHADEGGLPWGANLIHSPNEPELEARVAELYLKHRVRRVSAAAYMSLTPAIVRYAYSGVRLDAQGRVHRDNHVFAKISRPETARHFMSPAPAALLESLVAAGHLSVAEAELARKLPVAEDFTVESDSGGHTDNRPLAALLPTLSRLRDDLTAEHGYQRPIRLGAAGGLGTPSAVAAAFAMGAAYVVTGSVNQGAVESGLDASGKTMLAQADLADVIMAPAADMFEQGVEVQVLRRGTMFATRARTLRTLYRQFSGWDAIDEAARARVERDILREPFEAAWTSTRAFWESRDPQQVQRALDDPKHKMALVFRAYLGLSSRWAIDGVAERRADFQIWCGPAMGAFNAWVAGSFMEDPARREAVQIANNLLEGAAAVTRAGQLRSFGVPMPASAFDFRPRPLS